MRETVLEFGPGRRLVGVLCRPAGGVAPAPVCVVMTNSGIIHHVGANRLHVRLARYLAARGYPSLRYDLPGIGDSDLVGGAQDIGQTALAATSAAFDELQRLQVADGFVMLGLCSGASHSLLAAGRDPRVVGAVLVDPPAMFATRRHRLNQLVQVARRGLRPRVWWRLLRGAYPVRAMLRERSLEPGRPGMPVSVTGQQQDLRRQTAALLRDLVSRGVQLCFVITGHNREIYSYARQLLDAFPDVEGLPALARVEMRPSAGHTFGAEADRRFLEQRLGSWLRAAAFTGPAAADAGPAGPTDSHAPGVAR